jgi:hypothetical protein
VRYALGAFLLALIATNARRAHLQAVITDPPRAPQETVVPAVEGQVLAEVEPSITDLIRSLPWYAFHLKDFTTQWKRIEEALRDDPASALPSLWHRYARERDPGYKGLLAVLLSTDPSTHEGILGDLLAAENGGSKYYRCLALYALLRCRPIQESYEGQELNNLLRVLENGILSLLASDTTQDPPLLFGINISTSIPPPSFSRVGPPADLRLRELIFRWPEEVCPWMERLIDDARQECARADPAFAGTLLRRSLASDDPANLKKTLGWLTTSTISESDLATVARIAQETDDPELWRLSLGVIQGQKNDAGEAHFRSLFQSFQSDVEKSVSLLTIMKVSNAPRFEDLAKLSMLSKDARTRASALHLWSAASYDRARESIMQALLTDPDWEVRQLAANLFGWRVMMHGMDSITDSERDGLTRTMTVDPDECVRAAAERSLAAKRNTTKFDSDGNPYTVED